MSEVVLSMPPEAGARAGFEPPRILVVGDSIGEPLGVCPELGWVALMRDRVRLTHPDACVVNLSRTGLTTEDALEALPEALRRYDPTVLILQIGGNDGLRGAPVEELTRRLARLVRLGQASGSSVLLISVNLPVGGDAGYAKAFLWAYLRVAQATGARLVSSLLRNVGTDPRYMQADGRHPNADAQPRLLDRVWPKLAALLGADAEVTRARPPGIRRGP